MIEAVLDRTTVASLVEDCGLGRLQEIAAAPAGWADPTLGQSALAAELSRGRVVVRVDSERAELEVKREVDLAFFLRNQGFPAPQPVEDRRGRHHREVGDRHVVVFRSLDGRVKPVTQLLPTHVEACGRAIAEFQALGRTYKKGVEGRHGFEFVAERWMALRDRLPPFLRKVVRTINDEIEYLGGYLEGKLPKGVILRDLEPERLLVKGDKLVGILHLGGVCRGKYIFDLAAAINALCFVDGAYDLKRFESLLTGYESVRPLSLAEWDAFPSELRLAAVRLVVRRLDEAASGPLGLSVLSAIAGAMASPRDDGFPGPVQLFLDGYNRLLTLRREREGGMDDLLLALATGYDYRKYQKIRAPQRRRNRSS